VVNVGEDESELTSGMPWRSATVATVWVTLLW